MNQTKFDYNDTCRIKSVYVELPNFRKYFREENMDLIGRDKIQNRLTEQLGNKKDKNKNRAILITGFRGVGKSALVKSAIPEDSKCTTVNISLGQENLTYKDVLRSLIKGLKTKIIKENESQIITRQKRLFQLKIGGISAFFLFGVLSIILALFDGITISNLNNYKTYIPFITTLLLAIIAIIFMFLYQKEKQGKRIFKTIDDLEKLERRIDSIFTKGATIEKQFGIKNLFRFGANESYRNEYPIANEKEIELEFLKILNDNTFNEENWIFILDELDKIEVQTIENQSNEKNNSQSFSEGEGSIYMTKAIRKRQNAIVEILASMKNFLNTSPTKFVFIAGREMFDANLADIAARDSFFGSIFHDVIYVSSLLKADSFHNNYTGLSGTTESFLMRLILSKEIVKEQKLSALYDHISMGLPPNVKYKTNHGGDEKLFELEKRKVIYSLQVFILYLVYRSNGMPRKIIQLIEENVVYFKEGTNNLEEKSKRDLVALSSNYKSEQGSYFLKLDYKTQYQSGFINYLYRPYLVAHGRSTKYRSDKLLVSTSFLVDHLLKFHNQGFSWRNLELTPEILAINKEPELRRFVKRIKDSLFKTHLREIENGVHQYKFHSRLEHEIRYISNISEPNSAAFNFTLDESILIKKHYKEKLAELNKSHYANQSRKINYAHSISFINNLLGDLHFFDKEYDDAILHYKSVTQQMDSWVINDFTVNQFTLFARTKLKIGLTYEKIKAFGPALSNYLELQNKVLFFSNKLRKREFKSSPYLVGEYFKDQSSISMQINGEIKVLGQSFLASLIATEKTALDGLSSRHLKDNFRTFYKWINLYESMSEDNQFRAIRANYFYQRGGILFFKNGNIHLSHLSGAHKKKSFNFTDFNVCTKTKLNFNDHYKPSISAFIDYREALIEYIDIYRVTSDSKITEHQELFKSFMVSFIYMGNRFSEANYSGYGTRILVVMASLISKMGDTLLSFKNSEELNLEVFESEFLNPLSNNNNSWIDDLKIPFLNNNNISLDDLSQISVVEILKLYEISARLYDRGKRDINSSFQRRKILYTISSCKLTSKYIDNSNFLEFIRKIHTHFFSKIVKSNYQAHENTSRPQILKYEMIFSLESIFNTKREDGNNIYNHISTSIETKEAEIIFSRFLMKMNQYFGKNSLDLTGEYSYYIATHLGHTPSLYVRYIELRHYVKLKTTDLYESLGKLDSSYEGPNLALSLHENLNDLILNKDDLYKTYKTHLISNYKKHAQGNSKGDSELMIQNIADVIFALNTNINSLNIHGQSAIFGYSLLADMHWDMFIWCQMLKIFISKPTKEIDKDQFYNAKNIFEELIGGGIMHRLDPKQHAEKALEYYQLCLSTHHEGDGYKQLINNMFYLEDDFNDNFGHFALALERFNMNTEKIEKRMKHLNTILEESRLYEYKNYVSDKFN